MGTTDFSIKMDISRHQAEPSNVEDYINYLEMKLLDDLCGHEAVQYRRALAFFRGLSGDEVDILDRFFHDEFERGVKEGRSRERFDEEDK